MYLDTIGPASGINHGKSIPYTKEEVILSGHVFALGLPGLSGFAAEMTIFFGSFENADTFRRVLTIMATTSIVVTAVYILRVVAKLLFGEVQDEHHLTLTDATWEERLSTATLILAVAAIGCFPNFFVDIIKSSFTPVVNALMAAAPGTAAGTLPMF